jgi:hypothetical protein
LFADGGETETIERLRPELVVQASPSARLADLVRGWGGEIVAG